MIAKMRKPQRPTLERRRGKTEYSVGAVLTPAEMTQYILKYKLRNAWGRFDKDTAKQTISYAADYWRLERIDISDFPRFEIDVNFPNRSANAHPIVHYVNYGARFGTQREVLDGLHRMAMARARREKTILAWVGHDC